MPLKLNNTRNLVDPLNLRLKVLLYGFPGCGKTSWMATGNAPEVNRKLLAGVSETGHGRGLLSVAQAGFDFCELNSFNDFEEYCSGVPAKGYDVIGLDSLSWANKTFIKDKALSMPRAKGESQKRALGCPELDDYGTMAELSRKLVQRLIDQPQHIIVTAGLRVDKPDADNNGETLVGPDLPGQLFLGVSAMFDIVLCLRTRSLLRDPRDAKSRYTQRYFVTENTGGILAKNRLSVSDKGLSFLPTEVIFDKESGTGTFDWFLDKAKTEYTKYLLDHPKNAA
jgi:hypothetical protein